MTRAEIISLIQREAVAAQLDPTCMVRIAEIESSLDPNRINRTPQKNGKASMAAGLYQIMPFHKVQNVLDPVVNTRWAMNFTKRNHEHLRKNGVPVDCFTTYLAHQQGAGGAVKLWKAAQAGLRISDLDAETRRNIGANDGNNSFTTVEQFLRFWERKVMKSPISTLPDSIQIPLARLDGRAVAGITAFTLSIGVTYAVTRFVEKTTLRKALEF